MILVLDTSVLVSTLITKDTPPDRLYQAWLQGRFDLVTSEVQLAEFARVLQYERLQKYIRTRTGAAEMLQLARKRARQDFKANRQALAEGHRRQPVGECQMSIKITLPAADIPYGRVREWPSTNK